MSMMIQLSARRGENGQILIIILLVMIVGLSSGLFLLGRTTTDVSVSNKIEDSTRAFNAAEAGIEETIRSGISGTPLPLASGVNYQVAVSDYGSGANIYPATKQDPTDIGDVFTLWLVPHNDGTGGLTIDESSDYDGNNLVVCFSGNTPALGVTVYYRDASGEYRSAFAGYDPEPNSRAQPNNFIDLPSGAGTCNSAGYSYRAQITLGSISDFGSALNLNAVNVIPLALRIKPYYAAASIAVIPQGGFVLPKQGNQIDSTGTAGESTRRIQVSERYTVPAPFMDHALYSYGNADLSK